MQILTFTFLMCLLLPALSHAENISISTDANQEVTLTGKSCDVLLKQQEALCSWKSRVDLSTPKPDQQCKSDKKGKYKLVVQGCLPEFVKKYQKKKLTHEGPNCWGTAMSFQKLFSRPRFMWPEEIHYWMESSLCRKLAPHEELNPGDIINVYAPEKLDSIERHLRDAGTDFWEALYPKRLTSVKDDSGSDYTGFHRLLHSVTFISRELAFGKDSPAKNDPFYLHPLEEVYGRPRMEDKECQENQSLEPYLREYQKEPKKIRGTKCSYFSSAYRCENFAQYFSKASLSKANKESWATIVSLQQLQEKLFDFVVGSANPKDIEKWQVSLINTKANLSLKKSTEELKTPGLDVLREKFLVLEYFTAAGLLQSLKQLKLNF